MTKSTFLTMMALASAALASANTYDVKLLEDATVHGVRLKAGDYKLEVDGDKAVFHHGKNTTEAPAKVETTADKFRKTSFHYDNAAGEMRLQEIDLGGSNVRIVFAD
jgi:hypothetical protein